MTFFKRAAVRVERYWIYGRAGLFLLTMAALGALGSMTLALPFLVLGEDWWQLAAVVGFPFFLGQGFLTGMFEVSTFEEDRARLKEMRDEGRRRAVERLVRKAR
jgi:hypothetical protein